MRRLLPDRAEVGDLEAEYEVDTDRLARNGRHVRMVFVSSADGSATDEDGRSGGLATPADREVLATLRGLADVVLVGAGTARTEGYGPSRPAEPRRIRRRARGQDETPTIAVVSARLNLDPAAELFTALDARTVVLTHADAPAGRRAALEEVTEVITAGERAFDPVAALDALAGRGLGRVLCEGGPHLFGTLMHSRVVDELCLTVSPLLCGPGAGRIVSGGWRVEPATLALTRMLEADGTLFLRYSL